MPDAIAAHAPDVVLMAWTAPEGAAVEIEHDAPAGWAAGLRARGHRVAEAGAEPLGVAFGHAHLIETRADGVLAGAADPRALVSAVAEGQALIDSGSHADHSGSSAPAFAARTTRRRAWTGMTESHPTGPMTAEQLTDQVIGRLAGTADPRLRQIMQVLVRHLHAFAREVELTEAEWLAGIRFLTATGQACNDARQEFILLSDTLGLSMLVDQINHGNGETEVTESTVLGPFYVPGSPWRDHGESMVTWEGATGQPAVLRGRVRSAGGAALPGAVLDLWQNDAGGFYAVQQPGVQPPDNLRGRYRADDQGRYEVRTLRPVPYAIPDDGPVGRLLAATGRHPWRAAHIHAIVRADGHQPVTTHIFDAASDHLDGDAVFGVKDSLVKRFTELPDGTALLKHDFVLRPR